MPQIHRIVCPIDFSSTSERAADYAVRLARQLGAAVHFVHAWETPAYALPDGAVLFGPEVVARITTELQKQMDACIARHAQIDVAVKGHLVQGTPAREIVRMSGELGAELIVMGTHGRTGIAHLVLGSVAERVVRTSVVPVLTIPPDRTSALRP